MLLKTYTFYFRSAEPGGRSAHTPVDPRRDPFEPVLSHSDSEARARAEQMLSDRPDCLAIDVCFGNDLLFRVSQEPH